MSPMAPLLCILYLLLLCFTCNSQTNDASYSSFSQHDMETRAAQTNKEITNLSTQFSSDGQFSLQPFTEQMNSPAVTAPAQQGQRPGTPPDAQQFSSQQSMFPPPGQTQPPSQSPPACTLGNCHKWTMTIVLLFSQSLRKPDFMAVSNYIDAIVRSCNFARGAIKVLFFGPNPPKKGRDWLTTEEEYSAFKSVMKLEDYTTEQAENRTLFNFVLSFAANDTQRKAKDIYEGKYLLLITDIAISIEEMSLVPMLHFFNITARSILLTNSTNEALSLSRKPTSILHISKENQTTSAVADSFAENILALSPCDAKAMRPPSGPNGGPPPMPPPRKPPRPPPPPSPPTPPPPPPPGNSNWVPIVSVVAGLLLITCLIAVTVIIYSRTKYYWKAKIEEFRSEGRKISSEGSVELPSVIYEKMERLDRWAISRSNLTILYNQKLGAGAFSNVFKGKLSGMAPVCEINPSIEASRTYSDCEVAVKILPTYASKSEKADFIREMNVMKSFNYHPHMICLLGTVSENIEDCLVMECCARGDLLHLIRDRSKKIINGDGDSSELQVKDLMCYAWQISDGMDYLCSKGFVHRDLAARNILIDHKNTAKIGDFGLCRTMDQSLYTIGGGRLPIKWMSIESLKFCICTPKSDVWSYGVLLFELFSRGEVPYSSVNMANMIEHLDAGHRLDQPKDCPNEIYTIMLNCWKVDPSTRPSFEDIRTEVSKQLESVTDNYGYLPVSDLQKKQKNRICRSASDYDSVSETDSSVEDDHEQPTVLSLTPSGEVTV